MDEYIINGYAYPSISDENLNWWVFKLSWLSPFSYGFTAEGDLINLEDAKLVTAANQAGVRPMMVLTPLDKNGKFNDQVAVEVFNNPAAKENLINNILDNIIKKDIGGVDFDFEYLQKEYRDDYVSLVGDTQKRLAPLGYYTTVALAPKISTDQVGLLYEGHDYYGMGQAADYCLLMTYEWGYTFGPPMAVSPINSVRRVLEYGISQIPPEKILMGMSNYGYDWTLPYVKGESKAQKLSYDQAFERAKTYGAEIIFDEEAQAPYYEYADWEGKNHIVWFEDERSWRARLKLVEEYGLAGISIWNIMTKSPEVI